MQNAWKTRVYLLTLPMLFMVNTELCAEKLVIPVYERHQPPLVVFHNKKFSGVYIDLFREILLRAGIEPVFQPTPKKRVRILFEEGVSVLSCCDNPAWRMRPKEQQVQMFSESFYTTRDVFIFPEGKLFKVDNLAQLSTKKVAVIRGYGYQGSEWFGERIDIGSESELMQFIAFGRADVGIINEDVAREWLSGRQARIEFGNYHDVATLHVRVHRNRMDLLLSINKAISEMIADGTRDAILKRYFPEQH
jgi:hypothetical protein